MTGTRGCVQSLHLTFAIGGLTAVDNCSKLSPVVGDSAIGSALKMSSGHNCPLTQACAMNLDVGFWGKTAVGHSFVCAMCFLLLSLTRLSYSSFLHRGPESHVFRRRTCGGLSSLCLGTITSLCGGVNKCDSDRNLRNAKHNVCSLGAFAASRTVVPAQNNS